MDKPRPGEVRLWMLRIMISAIISLSGAIVWQDREYKRLDEATKKEIFKKDSLILQLNTKWMQAESERRAELVSLYEKYQQYREEAFKQLQRQQRELKRIR